MLYFFCMNFLKCTVQFLLKSKLQTPFKTMSEAAEFSANIGDMREKYKDKSETFTENDLVSKEPIGQFKAWFEEACQCPGILEANAMCLSTATKNGIPSGRYVLLKAYGSNGFNFFTNYTSRKGKELEENPHAALTFYWEPLKRSVRVEGKVERLPVQDSDEYFNSRPFASKIGASISEQSTPIPSRDVLNEREEALMSQYGDGKATLSRPEHWGGYRVIPQMIEFWQGQSNRVHDRIRFRIPKAGEEADGYLLHQGDSGWVYERLSP